MEENRLRKNIPYEAQIFRDAILLKSLIKFELKIMFQARNLGMPNRILSLTTELPILEIIGQWKYENLGQGCQKGQNIIITTKTWLISKRF